MLWLRKRVLPQMLQILLLFVAVSFVTDSLAVQNAVLTVTPTFSQALSNDDPGNSEDHIWKSPNYLSSVEDDSQLLHLVGRTYMDQAAERLIPAPPGMFFQPDRAPPDSIQ
ncbi:MAG: hypothetical protein M0Q01_13905 [Syntrophales bacterium]|nr:hypothetical protein [Syntrophales bacterium]